MTSKTDGWVACPNPAVGDELRWNEPIWAAPNKPRGKPDKMGEQRITARLVKSGEFMELDVIAVEKVSGGGQIKVQVGDNIRRKPTSLALGACSKNNTPNESL